MLTAESGPPHSILSPEMSLVLRPPAKQRALLYITVQEQSNAQSLPSPDLKSSVCDCVRVCSFHRASVYVRRECLQGCQRRFKIFSLLSAPTHFSLCTAAQICKSTLLRMQSTRSASIYSILLAPSLLHSPSLSVLLCSLFLSPPSSSLRCLHSVSAFLFGLSCSVHGICPH